MKAEKMQKRPKKVLKDREDQNFYGKKNSHETMCGLWRNEE